MRHSKRFRELGVKVEKEKEYEFSEAIGLLKELASAKFDETVEVSVRLGIDPKRDHVRGTTTLPHGTGKAKCILVITDGEFVKKAQSAGADFVGSDDYLKRIESGWFDFDVMIATPDMMPKISKFGKLLGPRGLMPNPKSGTVTQDVEKAIKEVKLGKVEFKMDKAGCIHCGVGKVSFDEKKIEENIFQLLKGLLEAKPAGAKGTYFKTVTLSSTMGPGIRLNSRSLLEVLK